MAVSSTPDERLQAVLLGVLSLPVEAKLAGQAILLHTMTAPYLKREAGRVLLASSSAEVLTSPVGKEVALDSLKLAVLAIFSKLADIQHPPIDLQTLHDFIVVYIRSNVPEDARLVARHVVTVLFRKKPSLSRGIETQMCPAYVQIMQDLASGGVRWLEKAIALRASIQALMQFGRVRDIFISSAAASEFWTALQLFYDIDMPKLFSEGLVDTSLSAYPQTILYVRIRYAIVKLLVSQAAKLPTETIVALLEGEAAFPDLPNNLTSLPSTTMINLSLLTDAEYHFGLSENLASKAGVEAKTHIRNSLRGLLPVKDDVLSGLDLVDTGMSQSKRKGKGRVATTVDNSYGTAATVRQPYA